MTAQMTDQPGVRFGIANGALVLAFCLAGLAGLTALATGALAVLVAGLAGLGLSLSMTASLGVIAWAMFTGFVENAYGQLSFADHDLVRLVLFPLAALLVAVVLGRSR